MRYLFVVVAAALLAGCTIQQRMPVKEVAYDFSDYAYYDRPYAESPEYRQNHSVQNESDKALAPAEGEVLAAVTKSKAANGKSEAETTQPGSATGMVAGQAAVTGQAGNLCATAAK